MENHAFQTEVKELLHLIIHSLYSNKEIFVRELVSNASDALDKLRYLTLQDDNYKSIVFDARIDLSFEKREVGGSTLTISDSGLGMDDADLITSLGTIARSGTKAFLDKLSKDEQRDSSLIGQFGVGFYSGFMAADKIEVITKKAGTDSAWKWVSDGKSGYTIEKGEREGHGTTVVLYLNAEGEEFANRWTLEDLIKRYSNHIASPIYLTYEESEYDNEGKVKSSTLKTERINSGTALWRRNKAELTDADYNEFYKNQSGDVNAPLLYVHTKAEGTLEYNTLFFVPSTAPFDLYRSDYKSGVKLYVRRVFITDDDKELLPSYLRFVRGVIDSEDLPLNVSREILQQNKTLVNIKSASVKKLLSSFASLATDAESGNEDAKKKWDAFIEHFNRPLKEGLYQDWANKDALMELVRFKTTNEVGSRTGFKQYVSRLKDGQKFIYYITGQSAEALKSSPLLEAYKARGIEVLLMDDEIDAVVVPMLHSYAAKAGEVEQRYELKAVNSAGAEAELDELGGENDKDAQAQKAKTMEPVLLKIKTALGDSVKDVRFSKRLVDFPSCIVQDEGDVSFQMASFMKSMGQAGPDIKPILEVNPAHPFLTRLSLMDDPETVKAASQVLLDEALLSEGLPLKDGAEFVRNVNKLLNAG